MPDKTNIILDIQGNFNTALNTANKSTSKFLINIESAKKALKDLEKINLEIKIKAKTEEIFKAKKFVLGLENDFDAAFNKATQSTSRFVRNVASARQALKSMEKNNLELKIKVRDEEVLKSRNNIEEILKLPKGLRTQLAGLAIGSKMNFELIKEDTIDKLNSAKDRLSGISTLAQKLPKGFRTQLAGLAVGSKMNFELIKEDTINKLNSAKDKLNSLKDKMIGISALAQKPYNITLALKDIASDKISNLANKPLTLRIMAKTAEVNSKIISTFNSIKKIASVPLNIVIGAIDKTKKVIGGIKAGITGIKNFATNVVLGDNTKSFFNATIGPAMQGEQEKVAMKHFIGIKNKDKNKEEVSSITDNYMETLKTEAAKSPFDPNDIIASGRKALSIMNGDTDKSVGLVKLAQDMAAVNPGKSVDDAMSALASMRTGDFAAAKDFGFEYSMNEYKALLGKGSKEDLTQDEMTKAFDMLLKDKATVQFAGGTEEFSKTVTGQWGLITGSLQTMGTNFGTAFLPLINEILGPLSQLLGNNTGAFVQFGQSAATVVQSIANSIGMFLTPAIEWIKANLPAIQTTVGNVFNGIVTLLQPVMAIFGSVFEIIGAAIQNFGPIVSEISETIMSKLGEVLEWLGPKIDWLKELFISSMPMISDAVQIAWDVINPALDLGITVFEGIADAVMWAMPIVQDILEKAWVVIEPIARGIGNVLGHVFDLVKKVIGFFGISASDEKRPKGHATGLPRVPYNNYPALLHEGEVVLTKKEVNQVQNRGSNNFNMSFNISGSSDPNLVAKQIVNEIKQAAFNI